MKRLSVLRFRTITRHRHPFWSWKRTKIVSIFEWQFCGNNEQFMHDSLCFRKEIVWEQHLLFVSFFLVLIFSFLSLWVFGIFEYKSEKICMTLCGKIKEDFFIVIIWWIMDERTGNENERMNVNYAPLLIFVNTRRN